MALVSGGFAQAAGGEVDVARLGKELTPVGADRAGNKDGSIPAWTGGDMKAPQGWRVGAPRPDPYGNDKRQFSIDATNVDRYKDKLAAGQIEMIKTVPGYRMDIYPTHRSCGYPDFFYDRTRKNAANAKLADNGYEIAEAIGAAVPFPLPRNGAEVIWNHKLNWKGEGFVAHFASYIPPKGGDSIGEAIVQDEFEMSPMWSPSNKGLADARGIEYQLLNVYTAPPSIAGDATLAQYNFAKPNDVWLYFASQRRVRRAPTYQYDAPVLNTENLEVVDQYFQFNGPLDRYNWKLLGKKELYVPYNTYQLNSPSQKVADVVKPKFFSRDLTRYELHRTWVVEATLKEGMRHTFPKRMFYIDEDSWTILVADMFDAQGKVWRTAEMGPYMAWEIPACVSGANSSFDHVSGRVLLDRVIGGGKDTDWLAAREGRLKAATFEPDGLRRATTR
ncbi:DUF1329 domain-containing protein [Pseudoduganella sp. FT93W]|uniref:DUF1329 domain-containing protein n=2 Tax=Duganella fentianensis TaxID=2692177 RepID=A0A845I238_9BURK|nr:DUF1329 domain-containing protein [Duganella fentianensis]MYN44768.1 DUF1329 domain-containing protein [Duganella fentianensis]